MFKPYLPDKWGPKFKEAGFTGPMVAAIMCVASSAEKQPDGRYLAVWSVTEVAKRTLFDRSASTDARALLKKLGIAKEVSSYYSGHAGEWDFTQIIEEKWTVPKTSKADISELSRRHWEQVSNRNQYCPQGPKVCPDCARVKSEDKSRRCKLPHLLTMGLEFGFIAAPTHLTYVWRGQKYHGKPAIKKAILERFDEVANVVADEKARRDGLNVEKEAA